MQKQIGNDVLRAVLLHGAELLCDFSSIAQVTLLRLIFDDTWQPRHFTKLYDNDKAKICQIDY